jgi:Immunoglobulin domain
MPWLLRTGSLTLMMAVMAAPAPAQEFQLLRGAVTSGGGWHTNGDVALGSAVLLSGGGTHQIVGWQLQSGFLSALAAPAPPPPLSQPPLIFQPPTGFTVPEGADVQFQVSAGGTPPLFYQWHHNGQVLPGAILPVLDLAHLGRADAGFYSVKVSNAYGSQFSPGAPLVVLSAPGLLVQPASQSLALGASLTLTVLAQGTPPLSYQWSHDGVPIPGALSETYNVAAVSQNDAGIYTVNVSNSAGSLTSNPATVVVLGPPFIITPPQDQSADPGDTVTFSVVAGGSAPLHYQWQVNGVNLPGATTNTLTLTSVQANARGRYRVVVANAAGVAVSDPAELIVLLGIPILNGADNFADRGLMPLAGNLGRIQGNNTGYTWETGETNHAGKLGGSSAWFEWTPSSNGIATFTTVGSAFDTLLAVYTGSDLTKLTEVESDDDGGPFRTSQAAFNVQAGIHYAVVVDGFLGRTGRFVLDWTLEATDLLLPEITHQPARLTLPAGTTAVFHVDATGSGLEYQWYFNGDPIDQATSDTLQLDGIQASNVGVYRVAVSNALGRVTRSRPATLELRPVLPPPVPDVFSVDKIADVRPLFRGPAPLGLTSIPGRRFGLSGDTSGFLSVSAGSELPFVVTGFGTMTDDGDGDCCGGVPRLLTYTNETDLAVTLNAQPDQDGYMIFEARTSSTNALVYALDSDGNCVACASGGRVRFPVQAGLVYLPAMTLFDYVREPVYLDVKFDLAVSNAWPAAEITAVEGDPLILQALATNTLSAATYQWYANGAAVEGATNAEFILPEVTAADAGRYEVKLSNLVCDVTSLVADVTVTAPVRLTIDVMEPEGAPELYIFASPGEQPMALQASSNFVDWVTLKVSDAYTNELTHTERDLIGTPFRVYRAVPWP